MGLGRLVRGCPGIAPLVSEIAQGQLACVDDERRQGLRSKQDSGVWE